MHAPSIHTRRAESVPKVYREPLPASQVQRVAGGRYVTHSDMLLWRRRRISVTSARMWRAVSWSSSATKRCSRCFASLTSSPSMSLCNSSLTFIRGLVN
jgi:hypothetical protein